MLEGRGHTQPTIQLLLLGFCLVTSAFISSASFSHLSFFLFFIFIDSCSLLLSLAISPLNWTFFAFSAIFIDRTHHNDGKLPLFPPHCFKNEEKDHIVYIAAFLFDSKNEFARIISINQLLYCVSLCLKILKLFAELDQQQLSV